MGMDGKDAFDRLRNEARMLAILAPDPRFPQALDMFDLDGNLFLAMEEVEGRISRSTFARSRCKAAPSPWSSW